MKFRSSLLACGVLATFWASAVSTLRADDFELYYLGGQSNMEGFGTNSHLDDTWKQPVAGAWIYQPTAQPDQQPASGPGKWWYGFRSIRLGMTVPRPFGNHFRACSCSPSAVQCTNAARSSVRRPASDRKSRFLSPRWDIDQPSTTPRRRTT